MYEIRVHEVQVKVLVYEINEVEVKVLMEAEGHVVNSKGVSSCLA